jgi:hypothetical protein
MATTIDESDDILDSDELLPTESDDPDDILDTDDDVDEFGRIY